MSQLPSRETVQQLRGTELSLRDYRNLPYEAVRQAWWDGFLASIFWCIAAAVVIGLVIVWANDRNTPPEISRPAGASRSAQTGPPAQSGEPAPSAPADEEENDTDRTPVSRTGNGYRLHIRSADPSPSTDPQSLQDPTEIPESPDNDREEPIAPLSIPAPGTITDWQWTWDKDERLWIPEPPAELPDGCTGWRFAWDDKRHQWTPVTVASSD
jgi:hypothetical protein